MPNLDQRRAQPGPGTGPTWTRDGQSGPGTGPTWTRDRPHLDQGRCPTRTRDRAQPGPCPGLAELVFSEEGVANPFLRKKTIPGMFFLSWGYPRIWIPGSPRLRISGLTPSQNKHSQGIFFLGRGWPTPSPEKKYLGMFFFFLRPKQKSEAPEKKFLGHGRRRPTFGPLGPIGESSGPHRGHSPGVLCMTS